MIRFIPLCQRPPSLCHRFTSVSHNTLSDTFFHCYEHGHSWHVCMYPLLKIVLKKLKVWPIFNIYIFYFEPRVWGLWTKDRTGKPESFDKWTNTLLVFFFFFMGIVYNKKDIECFQPYPLKSRLFSLFVQIKPTTRSTRLLVHMRWLLNPIFAKLLVKALWGVQSRVQHTCDVSDAAASGLVQQPKQGKPHVWWFYFNATIRTATTTFIKCRFWHPLWTTLFPSHHCVIKVPNDRHKNTDKANNFTDYLACRSYRGIRIKLGVQDFFHINKPLLPSSPCIRSSNNAD